MPLPPDCSVASLAAWLHDACESGSGLETLDYRPTAPANSVLRLTWETMARAVRELVENRVRSAIDDYWQRIVMFFPPSDEPAELPAHECASNAAFCVRANDLDSIVSRVLGAAK